MKLQVSLLLIFAFFGPVSAALAGSSNSLLDISPDGKQLLVVNADNGSLTLVDLIQKKKVREIPIGDKPEGVTWIGNTSLAAVTVYRENKVVFVDVAQGKVVESLKVAAEPYGIVANKDGSRVYVTHEYPGIVSEIDPHGLKVLREMPAGTMVRGIAITPDETRLYVTEFYTARLHAIDLKTGKLVDHWKGQGVDNLARNVVVHPTRPKAYVSHIRSQVTVNNGAGSIFPHVTVYDLKPGTEGARFTSLAMDTYNGVIVVTNPWESAISPDGKRLYTVYAGTDDMNVSTVVDDDYKEMEQKKLVRVGTNPRAVRVTPDNQTIIVANTLDFDVSLMDAQTLRTTDRITVCAPPKTPEWVLGKKVFSSAKPPLSRRMWVACASCHPDGAQDGRVWHQPEGLRKTPAFFGLAHTHPLHWSADRDEVQDFEYTIESRLMQGIGFLRGKIEPKVGFHPVELSEKTSGRSRELDAMAIYSNSFEPTLSPHIPAPGKLSDQAERGKAIFHDKTVGCATCHGGPYYTDSNLNRPFQLHDVGTGQDDPGEKIGPAYDTPTLVGVYRTAPYLHHGKARTLLEVLTTYNKEDKHGKTSHLSPEKLEDLVAFLQSLPYETLPSETPNTVKYRLVPKAKE